MSSPSHQQDTNSIEHLYGTSRQSPPQNPPSRRTLTQIGETRLSESPPEVAYAPRPYATAYLCANNYRPIAYQFQLDSSFALAQKLAEAASQISRAVWTDDGRRIRAIGRYILAGTVELEFRLAAQNEARMLDEVEQARAEAASVAGGTWEDWS
ncbi:hypothetical protein P7C70_g7294, partial [Phenoliferia sp. Uapishka_3]